MTTREGTVTFRYDELHRLTEACWSPTSCPGGPPAAPLACLACVGGLLSRPAPTTNPPPGETYRTYAYDPVGNRLTEASNAGTTTSAYDIADRLTSVTPPGGGPISYSFDNNGNQTGAGGTTFTYDYADRLKTATVTGTTETYTYAGDGVRLSASTGPQPNNTTKYLWDRTFGLPQLVIERDGADTLLRSYRYGWDLVNQTAGENTYWYQHDGLGSVSDLTGLSANSLLWSEYYPYGQVRLAGVGAGAPTNPFNFTGEQLDGLTALYHLRARQYDPATGRFLTVDPVAPHLLDPKVAAYLYAANNPVLVTDPSGQCPPCLVVAGAILLGAAAGGGSYTLGLGVSNFITTGEFSFEGFNPIDFGLSAAAGAVTGGTASYLTTAGRVAYGALAGFDATIWSMAAGGRRDPIELVVGTAFGGLGGRFDSGPGVIGFIRGLIGGGLLNAGQIEFQKLLERILGSAWASGAYGSAK